MDRNRTSRIITQRDFWCLVRLPILFVSAWVFPERTWRWIAVGAARVARRLKSKAYRDRAALFARTFGIDDDDPRAKQGILRAAFAANEAVLQCFREYRWGGWHPKLLVTGREHLADALSQGNGAIVWVQDMPYSHLVAKKALASIGFPLHHLTRPGHGFSGSRFGIRILNRLWTRIEDRYLAERITIQGQSTIGAMRVLRSRLGENSVVSITVGDQAVKTVAVPFFNAKMKLAVGPIALSLRHGAPLIPIFTIRSGDNGFEVIIGPPLSTEAGVGAVDGISVVASEYASRLERLYRDHADQRVPLSHVFVEQG